MHELDGYFREEASELVDGLTRDLLALEKNPSDPGLIARCLRLAHTLKGAARVVRQMRIGEMAHLIEDALAPFRDGEDAITSDYVSDLLQILERMREEIATLGLGKPQPGEQDKPASGAPLSAGSDERLETVRVDIAEMDGLLEGLSEASIQLGPLSSGYTSLDHAARLTELLREELEPARAGDRASARLYAKIVEVAQALGQATRDIGGALGRIERELGEVQTRAATLRLLPVGAILGTLELAARDAADMLGKGVVFSAKGGDVRLEGHILSAVRDALLHVIRNAVDHGIEPPEERIAQDKPVTGRIDIEIERLGRHVAFRCRDDGRGIDAAAVRKRAIDQGLIGAAEASTLDEAGLLGLVFRAGFTTAPEVTELSGRGVGLDVVRSVADRLRGSVRIESRAQRGTLIEVLVPVSLSSMPVLSVAFGATTALVPLDMVRGTQRVLASERLSGADGELILFGDRAVPFAPLASLLGLSSEGAEARAFSAVVVQSGSSWMALGVDRLLGTMDVVVRPLPKGAGAPKGVAGAAFDALGDPLLVLDPARLSVTNTGERRASAAKAPVKRLPILVIDDSLTTRMLEQSILEAAGYEVDLCASAEDALRKARAQRYGLFIVDVEMPGMNGFEFTKATRVDPELRQVPVIMVTSLSQAQDRERGRAAGASAYIVKGEFDQKHFVRKVAELLGAP